jgi:hypothetical protein
VGHAWVLEWDQERGQVFRSGSLSGVRPRVGLAVGPSMGWDQVLVQEWCWSRNGTTRCRSWWGAGLCAGEGPGVGPGMGPGVGPGVGSVVGAGPGEASRGVMCWSRCGPWSWTRCVSWRMIV